MHYLIFIVTSLIWGSGFFLMKQAGFAFGPLTIGATSTLGGAVVLWSFWAIRRSSWHISRQHIIPLVFVSVLGYIFPYAAQPFLIGMIGHGFIGMMVSMVPVLTIVVSIPLLRVYPSRKQLAGVLVGMVCIGLMVVDGLDRDAKPMFLLMAVSVPFCYAISNTLIQKYFQDLPPIVLAAIFMSIATLTLSPISLAVERVIVDDRFLLAIGAILLLSVFARGLAMLLFYKMIQDKGPLFAGMVTYVIPVEALMWSWMDNERVTLTQVFVILIILLMVGIVQRDIVRRSQKGG